MTASGVDLSHTNVSPWWWSPATSAVKTLARTGRWFTTEQVRGLGVPDPSDFHHWGVLMAAAYSSGQIEPVGALIGLDGRARRAWVGVPGRDVDETG